MCLGNRQMFLSITNFREIGISQHEPGGQGQEREVNQLGLRASRTKHIALTERHNAVTVQPLLKAPQSTGRVLECLGESARRGPSGGVSTLTRGAPAFQD